MIDTIISFPLDIERVIGDMLRAERNDEWLKRAQLLHERYMGQGKNQGEPFLNDYTDALTYLALRVPATYAQILGAFSAVSEVVPSWIPKTMLDIGSGSGAGVWAVNAKFPSITQVTCVDENPHVITIGKKILNNLNLPISVMWKKADVVRGIELEEQMFDVVLISNVLNELNSEQREKVLGQAFNHCKGIMIVVEPGTPTGSAIAESVFYNFSHEIPIGPYVSNNLIDRKDYWLHFPQRFKRPEFLRRVRQYMRESQLMASDWEEAKYSYAAVGKILPEIKPWGRCVGNVELQKGFLEVMILTQNELFKIKVMKRYKKQYNFAKNLRWGEIILHKFLLYDTLREAYESPS